MSSLFKYSAVLRTIKAHECCHRLKKEEKKAFKSQMHSMIQDIEETALLSEHVNLLTAEIESETADQKIQDFEMQVDLAEEKQ
ncbi:hypothetical protein BDDG_12299 [Blastomyces dermatitidis ATCC 18188]|uniref:Uncharacterized protein n=1 Tax=Ajellomyces dermatitidis (strain ATCC 18188 / CBS 674.68) TaxID=653446 RepID=A0A0J9ERG1_AJEDA|nr:hypothetical protein BDDG_12299 [Blastomyces dermatitidis ATCC 18188]